jgi:hypothetical protein
LVFDFIWEEIKAISESHLKSCDYAPYIVHMIERVSDRTFGCNKEHHPLRIKNDLRAPVDQRRAVTPRVSPPRAASRRGQQGDKPQMILLHPHTTMSKIKRMNKIKIKLMIKRKSLIKGGDKDDGDHQGLRLKLSHPRVHQTVQRDHPMNNILGDIKKG